MTAHNGIDDALFADWVFRIVRDRTEGWGELYWQQLRVLDPRLAALAMIGNPAFGDSVREVLKRNGDSESLEILFWATVFDDDDVTAKLVIDQVIEQGNERARKEGEMT